MVIQVAERAAYHRIQGLPALERCLRWCGHHRVFKHTCPRTDYSASGVDDSPRHALKACRVIRETRWHSPEGCARLFAHYRGHIPGSSQPPWGRGQNLAPALGTGHTRRWYSVDSPFSQESTNASDHAVSCHHSGDNIRGCSLVLTDRRQHHQSDSKRLWWRPNLYRIQPGALCVPDRRKLERCGPERGEPDGRDAGGRDPELGRSDRGDPDRRGPDRCGPAPSKLERRNFHRCRVLDYYQLGGRLLLHQQRPGLGQWHGPNGVGYLGSCTDSRTHHPAVGPLGHDRRAASSAARVMCGWGPVQVVVSGSVVQAKCGQDTASRRPPQRRSTSQSGCPI